MEVPLLEASVHGEFAGPEAIYHSGLVKSNTSVRGAFSSSHGAMRRLARILWAALAARQTEDLLWTLACQTFELPPLPWLGEECSSAVHGEGGSLRALAC